MTPVSKEVARQKSDDFYCNDFFRRSSRGLNYFRVAPEEVRHQSDGNLWSEFARTRDYKVGISGYHRDEISATLTS
jgi:hypothetical protein